MHAMRMIVVIAATGALVACRRERPPTAYGGGPRAQSAVDDAVALIALAKCDRDMRCGRIGAGLQFETREQCESVTAGGLTSELHVADCLSGTNDSAVKQCMAEVQNESCDASAKVSAHPICRGDKVCVR